jgi:hypothetical protein
MWVGCQRHVPAALPPVKRPGTHCIGDWVGPPGPVWTGAENLAHTGIRFPDGPNRSEPLYRLSYQKPNACRGATDNSIFQLQCCLV